MAEASSTSVPTAATRRSIMADEDNPTAPRVKLFAAGIHR
jgi:hypothetical protein